MSHADDERADLIALSSHGRGGVGRQDYVKLGSTVDRILSEAPCPIFFVSAVAPEADLPATTEDGAHAAGAQRGPSTRP